jgi:hypothetical protein
LKFIENGYEETAMPSVIDFVSYNLISQFFWGWQRVKIMLILGPQKVAKIGWT